MSLYEELQPFVGRSVGPPAVAREPVNAAMIAHWCDAMGDRSPLYTDVGYAPPAMLQVWTMRRWASDRPLDSGFDVLGILDRAGFVGVVATNSEQQYLRYLKPGDVLTEETKVESVSEEKSTGLGRGHFVTFLHEFRDQHGELVGRMRFRVRKFRLPLFQRLSE
jgi:acyl dehydratase